MPSFTGSNQIPPDDKKQIRVGLWTLILLILAVGLSIALSALDDVKGSPLFDSGVLSQTVSAVAIIGAALGPVLLQNYRNSQIIKHEVKNDHKTNLRVESDQRHQITSNQNMTLLDEIRKTQALVNRTGRKLDAIDKKFDGKIDDLRLESQAVQHENVRRFQQLEN